MPALLTPSAMTRAEVVMDEDIHRIALALPETYERPHRRKPTFWVHERIFCMLRPGEAHVVVKLERDDQLNMIEGHPEAVAPARLCSLHGWTNLFPERAGPELTALVLRLAWTHVAPKRLVRGQT
jgi:YjbR